MYATATFGIVLYIVFRYDSWAQKKKVLKIENCS